MGVAAQNPPHLKAIIPIEGDAFNYSWTHPDGVMRCLQLNMWCSMMMGLNSIPPLYTDVEGRWLKIWNHHLEHNEELLLSLYDHPTEDTFMREGSVLYMTDKIKAATYIMGGWRDVCFPWTFSIYNGINATKKILIGPWTHGPINTADPGPNIDYVEEMLRWFDYWLKGIDTGIMNEPPITIWVQGRDGKWRHENEWPITRGKETTFYLHPGGALESRPYQGKGQSDSFDHNTTVGTCRGLEDASGLPIGLPLDQREDEALSLVYTTEPLPEDTEITGIPVVKLYASTSADEGVFVAKLNDVAPDGSSASITYGCLNVAHRESREKLLPVKPGEVYELTIELRDTSYLVKAGHRLRLAIASSDFPFIWPTTKAAVNTVYHSQKYPSQIVFPFIPEQKPSLPAPKLREILPPAQLPITMEYSKPEWRIERDLASSTVTVHCGIEEKVIVSPTTTAELLLHARVMASALDPAATKAVTDCCFNIEGHKLGSVTVKANVISTPKGGHAAVNIIVNGLLTFTKRWSRP